MVKLALNQSLWVPSLRQLKPPKCAENLASERGQQLGPPLPRLRAARQRLVQALRSRPSRVQNTWVP